MIASCLTMGMLGAAWILLGILTAIRMERAIRNALMINYVLLLFPPVWVTVLGLFVLPLAIAQAHRVLKCAEDLKNAQRAQLQQPTADD